jgi:hypothetical protein
VKTYRVILSSYSQSSSFIIDLNKKEVELLQVVSGATKNLMVGLTLMLEEEYQRQIADES